MSHSTNWLRERVPISGEQLREWTNEPVPNHMKRWWFPQEQQYAHPEYEIMKALRAVPGQFHKIEG